MLHAIVQRSHRLVWAFVLIALSVFALPDSAAAASLPETKKLTASDADGGDGFGRWTAISGDRAIVGAYQADPQGAGAAYIFERNAGGVDSWGEVKKLTASDGEDFDNFGERVAIDGNTAIVGVRSEDEGGLSAGAAYVFQRDIGGAGNWGEVKKLTASDPAPLDHYGDSVAVDADTIVIGADDADAAYVYGRDVGGSNNWGQVAVLTASNAAATGNFGGSVSISGDTLVVGAALEAGVGFTSGAAYVFDRDAGGVDNWGEVKRITASDEDINDIFGISVSITADTVIIGASKENGTGAAYIYQRNEGGADNWGEVIKLSSSDIEDGDRFGFNVAISGDTVVVGARREATAGPNAGAAYAFRRNLGGADNWGEVTRLSSSDIAAGDEFSFSLAVDGNTVIVGAHGADPVGFGSGAAYVFNLLLPKPTATITPTVTPTVPPSVGGIGIDSDSRSLPLETANPDSSSWAIARALALAILAATLALVAVSGSAWYARRQT